MLDYEACHRAMVVNRINGYMTKKHLTLTLIKAGMERDDCDDIGRFFGGKYDEKKRKKYPSFINGGQSYDMARGIVRSRAKPSGELTAAENAKYEEKTVEMQENIICGEREEKEVHIKMLLLAILLNDRAEVENENTGELENRNPFQAMFYIKEKGKYETKKDILKKNMELIEYVSKKLYLPDELLQEARAVYFKSQIKSQKKYIEYAAKLLLKTIEGISSSDQQWETKAKEAIQYYFDMAYTPEIKDNWNDIDTFRTYLEKEHMFCFKTNKEDFELDEDEIYNKAIAKYTIRECNKENVLYAIDGLAKYLNNQAQLSLENILESAQLISQCFNFVYRISEREMEKIENVVKKLKVYFKENHSFFFSSIEERKSFIEYGTIYKNLATGHDESYERISNLILRSLLVEDLTYASSFINRMINSVMIKYEPVEALVKLQQFEEKKGGYSGLILDFQTYATLSFIQAFDAMWEKDKEFYLNYFEEHLFKAVGKTGAYLWEDGLKFYKNDLYDEILTGYDFYIKLSDYLTTKCFVDTKASTNNEYINKRIKNAVLDIRYLIETDN